MMINSRKTVLRLLLLTSLSLLAAHIFYYFPDDKFELSSLFSSFDFFAGLAATLLWLILFFASSLYFRFWARTAVITAVLLPSAVSAYLGLFYKIPVSSMLIVNLIESRHYANEAGNFFSKGVFLDIFLILLLFAAFSAAAGAGLSKKNVFKSKWFLCLFLYYCFFVSMFDCVYNSVYPVKKIFEPLQYYFTYQKHRPLIMSRIRDFESMPVQPVKSSNVSSPYVFLHIGESVRSDHVPMNGYSRNTMPNMLREYENGSLVNFPSALSFAVQTRVSIVGILTPAVIRDPVMRSQSFIPLLMSSGFNVHALLSSMHRLLPEADSPLSTFFKGCSTTFFTFQRAHAVLPELDRLLKLEEAKKSCLLMYYGEGSHFPSFGYKPEFSVFEPVTNEFTKDIRRINNYDNTIIETDDFIAQVQKKFRDKSAVYIFFSDHGDYLGENGCWARGGDDMPQDCCRYIPFWIWVSDKFKTENNEKFENLRMNGQRLKMVSHDNVYHTVLGLFGIKTPQYSSKLDLFSADAENFSGRLPGEIPADTFYFDDIIFEKNSEDILPLEETQRMRRERLYRYLSETMHVER